MECFPVSVLLVFHLDDDNDRQTDRQTDKKTRVAFFRVVNLRSEGQSGHYCVCHGTTCHETRFLFVELLLPQSCNYINEGEVSELDLIQVLDLRARLLIKIVQFSSERGSCAGRFKRVVRQILVCGRWPNVESCE